jgi:NhaA family Na+:H+ antiporter
VAIGLITPARPLRSEPEAERIADRLSADTAVTAEEVRDISFELRESVSLAERIEELLHPWSSYVIVPVFALANAGVALSWSGLADAAGSAVSLGVVAGLVIGKALGITLAIALLVRSGWGRLPDDLTWRHVVGLGALAGIGFTVSLFISGLAYDTASDATDAALGVLAASVLAAVAGTLILRARHA